MLFWDTPPAGVPLTLGLWLTPADVVPLDVVDVPAVIVNKLTGFVDFLLPDILIKYFQ